MLYSNIRLFCVLDEPNVDRLWQDRLTRNDEVIQNVLPGLIKNISKKQASI